MTRRCAPLWAIAATALTTSHAALAADEDGPLVQPLRLDVSAAAQVNMLDDVSIAPGALTDATSGTLAAVIAPAVPLANDPDHWYFQPSIAIWAAGISGDIGVGRFTTRVSASALDVLEESDSLIGLTGSFQFGKGKIGGYVEGTYMEIGADVGRNSRIHSVSQLLIAEFGVSYEIGRWAMDYTATTDKPARDLVLQLTAGGRYTDVDQEFEFPIIANRSGGESWVDPMIGCNVSVPISQHFSFCAVGAVGGFGVASDFAWRAGAAIAWDFNLGRFPSSLQFGYLAIGDDYTTGSGRDRFEWNTILHGPVLNWLIRF